MDLIIGNHSYYLLIGLLTGALFFLMVGFRELKQQCLEGLLYLTISLFFIVVHIFLIFNLPIDNPIYHLIANYNMWDWCFTIFAPSLIILFLLLGLYNLMIADFRTALIKIFFGLTLVCYLFMLGSNWSADIKGIITILWCFIWFDVELSNAL